jgi:para-nitrobenzyl esterase
MTTRRNFLKSAGIVTTIAGLDFALPASAASIQDIIKEGGITASSSNAVVDTSYGKVRGYTRNNIYTFKGIPFGADTSGRRFLPALKPTPWTGVKDVLSYGPISPQKINTGWSSQEYAFLYQWVDGLQSEDCLRLNIWTPAINKNDKKRPVLVWLHGGGFVTGSSHEHPSYNGENLSHLGDVVVVSLNHRLNLFGHLDLSAFSPEYSYRHA